MTKVENMNIERCRHPDEYPYFIEVYWNERGIDENGNEVQRVEGYGFDDEDKFHRDAEGFISGGWKDHVEKLIIKFNTCSTKT